jgi:hypothetical protein
MKTSETKRKKVTPATIKRWYKLKNNDSIDALIKELNEYDHTYDSIVHAIAAVCYRAGHAMNNSNSGGISGFQGGAVMWEFIRKWGHYEGPMKLLDYRNMLYPQYEDHFDKTINKETFNWLKDHAEKRLADNAKVSNDILRHWKGILNGKVPFGYEIRED